MPAALNTEGTSTAMPARPAAGENEPALHLVTALDPRHEDPAGHGWQAVRFPVSPPDVKDQGGHLEHVA